MSSELNNLLEFIYEYDFEAVQEWLEEDIDFFKREPEASFDTLSAAMYGDDQEESLEMVELLVKHGADVKSLSKEGACLLKLACQYHKESVANLLIQNGASIHAQDMHGITPLMWAAAYSSPPLVKHLIGLGVHIDQRDVDGNSALMRAAHGGNLNTIKVLVEAGAQLDFENKYKLNALDLAGMSSHMKKEEAVQYLAPIYCAMHEKQELLTATGSLSAEELLAADAGHKNSVRL